MAGEICLPDKTSGLRPVFHLYVSGATQKSTEALLNSKRALSDLFEGNYELRVTGIYQEPQKAITADVHVVPTLIREYPAPVLRVAGDFSSEKKIRSRLVTGTLNEVPDA